MWIFSGKYFSKKPSDYVIATGRKASVREFIELAAIELGWQGIIWEGEGLSEIGRRVDNNNIVIKIDKNYFRPCEVNSLIGNPSKAIKELNWKPKITLEDLIKDMIKHDKELAEKESLLLRKGFDLKISKRINEKTYFPK